jgi:hypothetical protein
MRGAIKLLDKDALQEWIDVAASHGHYDCVVLLMNALKAK